MIEKLTLQRIKDNLKAGINELADMDITRAGLAKELNEMLMCYKTADEVMGFDQKAVQLESLIEITKFELNERMNHLENTQRNMSINSGTQRSAAEQTTSSSRYDNWSVSLSDLSDLMLPRRDE